jgi:hypothetical protein
MKIKITLLNLLFLCTTTIFAQQDSSKTSAPVQVNFQTPLSHEQIIRNARTELEQAIRTDDPAWAALWVDSLRRLENEQWLGLLWDERWMLYYWEGALGNLFEEAAIANRDMLTNTPRKKSINDDPLFPLIDSTVLSRRFDLYNQIQSGFLNVEEKAFSVLLLDYLLRLNKDARDWTIRCNAFLKKFPESRYKAMVDYMNPYVYLPPASVTAPPKPNRKKGWSLDASLWTGRWTETAERTLDAPIGFDIGLSFWKRSRILGFRGGFGSRRLLQPVYDGNIEWPRGEKYNLGQFEAEWGYRIINTSKVKVYPVVCAGLQWLTPPSPDDESVDDPYPGVNYTTFHYGATLNFDFKLKVQQAGKPGEHPAGSYVGARVRAGWKGLDWNAEDDVLVGNLFFLGVGVTTFAYRKVQ